MHLASVAAVEDRVHQLVDEMSERKTFVPFLFDRYIGDFLRPYGDEFVVVDCSVEELNAAEFLSQLEESHMLDLDDLDYEELMFSQEEEIEEEEAEEVNDPMETRGSMKRSRTHNYPKKKKLLCAMLG